MSAGAAPSAGRGRVRPWPVSRLPVLGVLAPCVPSFCVSVFSSPSYEDLCRGLGTGPGVGDTGPPTTGRAAGAMDLGVSFLSSPLLPLSVTEQGKDRLKRATLFPVPGRDGVECIDSSCRPHPPLCDVGRASVLTMHKAGALRPHFSKMRQRPRTSGALGTEYSKGRDKDEDCQALRTPSRLISLGRSVNPRGVGRKPSRAPESCTALTPGGGRSRWGLCGCGGGEERVFF